MLFALALAERILTRLKSLALVILSVFELILLATLNEKNWRFRVEVEGLN